MSPIQAPFSCTYSPNIPELLFDLRCSVAISTYQAGKVILIGAPDTKQLVQLPRNFDKPMGIALDGDRLAIATRDKVVVMRNVPQMAKNFPGQPNVYDGLFLPRATYFTGETDIHDIHWIDQELWAVNTNFSCLVKIDDQYSFIPSWKPPFVNEIAPEDACHFNGVAFENKKPVFATALGKSNTREGWRANKINGGVLINIQSNQIINETLAMPHSPRIYDGRLFLLLSATGELVEIDRNTGGVISRKNFNGFVRGMDKLGDHLFVGLSKIRETSSAFKDLPVSGKSVFSGIAVIHFPTMRIVGYIKYETSVEEIYDVKILPGIRRANIVSHEKDGKLAITTPVGDYWGMKSDEHDKR